MRTALTCLTAILVFAGYATAADPTGSWKSTIVFHEKQVDSLLNLRLDSEGPTLTGGTFDGPNSRENFITAARYKSGEISFSVVREAGGDKFLVRHSGRLSGDTITGKAIIDYGDRTHTSEWVAKRLK